MSANESASSPPLRKDKAPSKHSPPKLAPTKPVPTQALPTRRMAFGKQIEILRAYPAVCGASPRPVKNAEIGPLVGLAPETVGFANSFFVAIGLLERSDTGACIPCAELMAFYRAHQWGPEDAPHKLAPVFQEAWFSKALLPKLRFRPLAEEEAITTLADASAAGPEYRPQLKMVLDYLAAVGITERDNGSIRLTQRAEAAGPPTNGPPPSSEQSADKPEDNRASEKRIGQVSTAFTKASNAAIHLSVDFSVDMNEMSTWELDRITRFMKGLAEVMAAKAGMEKVESKEQ